MAQESDRPWLPGTAEAVGGYVHTVGGQSLNGDVLQPFMDLGGC